MDKFDELSLVAAVAGLSRQHSVELSDFEAWVSNHRIVHFMALRFFNIGFPFAMTRNRIDAQADNLAVALGELGLQSSGGPALSCRPE